MTSIFIIQITFVPLLKFRKEIWIEVSIFRFAIKIGVQVESHDGECFIRQAEDEVSNEYIMLCILGIFIYEYDP